MQKKLIALAIAGLSSAAFAQSNVTISGQMRVAVDNVRSGGATAANADLTSRTRVTDQNSNLKFAGTESLGGGLTAFWQVESAIGTDNNIGTTGSNVGTTNTATVGTRNTAIGLRGAFGEVFIGKWDAHYNSMANVEGAGLADGLALAANSLTLLNSINGTAITGSGRNNNTINYLSPNMSGFQVFAQYGTGAEATTALQAKKDNSLNLRLQYNNGPIAVSYSYLANNGTGAGVPTAAGTFTCISATGAITTGNAACPATSTAIGGASAAATLGQGNDVRSNRFGGAYTFPMGLKVGLVWDKSKNTAKTAVETYRERSAWVLPVSYKMGNNTFSLSYGKTNNVGAEATAAAAVTTATGAKMTMLGYEYAMSKRTSVSATYIQVNNDTNAVYDFWHPSSNVSGAGAVPAGSDPRMWSFGMKHTF